MSRWVAIVGAAALVGFENHAIGTPWYVAAIAGALTALTMEAFIKAIRNN